MRIFRERYWFSSRCRYSGGGLDPFASRFGNGIENKKTIPRFGVRGRSVQASVQRMLGYRRTGRSGSVDGVDGQRGGV
jgi:hypothetical protein